MLRTLCPRFHGTVLHNGENYLRLEDLTRPFRNPCIIDIKMGRVTWDPDATDAKRVREESKYPPLKMSGFQFLGCRVSYSRARAESLRADYYQNFVLRPILIFIWPMIWGLFLKVNSLIY